VCKSKLMCISQRRIWLFSGTNSIPRHFVDGMLITDQVICDIDECRENVAFVRIYVTKIIVDCSKMTIIMIP